MANQDEDGTEHEDTSSRKWLLMENTGENVRINNNYDGCFHKRQAVIQLNTVMHSHAFLAVYAPEFKHLCLVYTYKKTTLIN